MHFPQLTPCHQVNSLKSLLHEQFNTLLQTIKSFLIWKNFYHRNWVLGTNNPELHYHTAPKVPAPKPWCPRSVGSSKETTQHLALLLIADEDALLGTFVPFTKLSSIGLLIIITNLFIYIRRPDKQIYLINQIAFSHPTSNNMLHVSTFPCPRRLFSSSIGSWLWWPQPRQATKLSLFQPPGVYNEPEMGQNHQSHCCCCLDNISNSAAASGCSMSRPEEPLPVLPCSCPPRGPQLLHSQVNFISQERARKCTVDFHSQVNSLLTSSISGKLATVAQFSHCGAVILLLRAWYCHKVPHNLLHRTPTVGRVLLSLWHSIRSDTA